MNTSVHAEDEALFDFESLVFRASHVLQIPAVLFKVLECASDPETDIETLVEVISADPVFSAKIVRLANCPVFYRGYDVESLQQAVVRIGRAEIHALCAVIICSGETRKLNCSVIRLGDFVFQSLFSAHLAKDMALAAGVDASVAFTAALFQGLGIMIMVDENPEEMARLMMSAVESDLNLPSAIQQEHGIDTFALSAAIGRLWTLPEPMVVAMEAASNASYDGQYAELASCVREAVELAETSGAESIESKLEAPVLSQTDAAQDAMIEKSKERTTQILEYM